ncbi:hypothetical protein BGX20_002939, partial [Mortierella sp. AD010]
MPRKFPRALRSPTILHVFSQDSSLTSRLSPLLDMISSSVTVSDQRDPDTEIQDQPEQLITPPAPALVPPTLPRLDSGIGLIDD